MLFQNRVDGSPQIPDAFAVDDAHFEDSLFLTRREVIQDEVFHFAWLERVQVQDAINRKLNRIVVHFELFSAIGVAQGRNKTRIFLWRVNRKS